MVKQKALFLDRDGVINRDYGYVGRVEDFEFIDGILDLIYKAWLDGYLPIIVTNQSGIGRGYYTFEDFESVTSFMLDTMQKFGIGIKREQLFFCPHTPNDNCNCRKPKSGMFLEAIKEFNIDIDNSIMIGDKLTDIEASKGAGVAHQILIDTNQSIKWEDIDGF